jgi:bifunctional N-acetylglucosamine-1-phosphate-uridyltransferase/glucosamine-1-phosphate-acetyltransferase GlmU-like protein
MHDASTPVQVVKGAFPDLSMDFVVQEATKSSREDAVRSALQVLPKAASGVMVVSGSLPLLTPEMLDQAALEGSRDRAAGVVDFAAASHDGGSGNALGQGLQWAALAPLREALSKSGGSPCNPLLA